MTVIASFPPEVTPEIGPVRQAVDWDVVVIGGGLSGSLVADRLSQDGNRVLVLESGPAQSKMSPANPGRWPAPIHFQDGEGGRRRHEAALLGHGPGGSSAIYGAALERFEDRDFDGSRPSPKDALPTAWPVTAAEMAPWYDAAERQLGVSSRAPAISLRDRAMVDALRANGHVPYRLPVAIAYRPGCGECQGQRCARACKGDGWTRILSPALSDGRVALRCGVHVTDMSPNSDRTVRIGVEGQAPIRASHVVLTAGALNTPRILLGSPRLFTNGPHPLIGRGVMLHSTDLFTVGVPRRVPADGPKKSIGLRDFYDLPEGRGGEVQSLGFDLAPRLVSMFLCQKLAARGIPVNKVLRAALHLPAKLLLRHLGTPPVLATVLEDFPYAGNQIAASPEGCTLDQPIEIRYSAGQELGVRAKAMRHQIRAAFAPLPVRFLLRRSEPNLGHPCGSVRMGTDPRTAPVDPSGRLRGTNASVFVADASVFPSSGGTNPALTVAANALRIAEGICARLEAENAAQKVSA